MIQEGLEALRASGTSNMVIHLYVDNKNGLKALTGGPSSGREYIRQSLEEMRILRIKGCEILEKWTPSHRNIPGNGRANTLAKNRLQDTPCTWTRATLTWG